MHLLGIIEIIIQIYFAVHAGRTGRYGWIFLILFFPLIGSLIYFFIEYLPEMQMEAKIKKSRNQSPRKNISQLKRELELTDCIKNRINLAEAYYHEGQYEASIDLLEKSLTGANAKDPHILEGLSFSHYKKEDYAKAKEYLSLLKENTEGKLASNLRLMKAKTHEALGEAEKALEEYKAIANSYESEEARCRYALLLKKCGQHDSAKEQFEEILKNAKLYPKQYKKFQGKWVAIAREEVR
ncbi:MAG: hypothetical protein OEV42_04305 [Deltaproteobacteria bacterium]|nr:hypothetical protein [Deltaproteobacteria bacterium]